MSRLTDIVITAVPVRVAIRRHITKERPCVQRLPHDVGESLSRWFNAAFDKLPATTL